jgi:hypothetical protein
VQSRDGHGTLVMLEVPIVQQDLLGESASSSIYAARSSTRS